MRFNTGFQPLSSALRNAVNTSIPKREPNEIIIVHHITDCRDYVQYEVERNSKTLGLKFERIRYESHEANTN